MGFQRAKWHSGLIYRQVCTTCKKTVTYSDYNLDFRPWYADGYVDCPVCKRHIRHNESYAIKSPEEVAATAAAEAGTAKFCVQCGHAFAEGDCFCCKCGAKRT